MKQLIFQSPKKNIINKVKNMFHITIRHDILRIEFISLFNRVEKVFDLNVVDVVGCSVATEFIFGRRSRTPLL